MAERRSRGIFRRRLRLGFAACGAASAVFVSACAGGGEGRRESRAEGQDARAAALSGNGESEPLGESLSAQDPSAPRLTPQEAEAGWRLLFDGTLDGWRGYRRDGVPAGWSAEDGALAFTPGRGGGDLVTMDQFADFELAFDWKIGPGGNSGVFFRLTEAETAPYWTGPEMQVLDDDGHADGGAPETSAGANYGLHAPSRAAAKPAGEWNSARIVARGPRVEHWLNGERVVVYELWTDEWRAKVAKTKFSEWPGYGMAESGHIGLQDHGDPVWYRNIKLREFR